MPHISAFYRDLLEAFPHAERDALRILAGNAAKLNGKRAGAYGYLVDGNMEIANKAIEGFGVEAIRDNQWGEFYLDIGILYVNTGDTYSPTVLYDTRKGKFYVTTYGDYIEHEERRGRKFQ